MNRRSSRCAAIAALANGLDAAHAEAEGTYLVQPGQTLWHIAAEVAGDPYLWPLLYRANRDQIKDPSLLYPGQELTIPDFGKPSEPEGVSAPAPETPPE